MADRLAEMEVRTLSDKLAVLHANAPVGMLTKGPAEVEKNTLGQTLGKGEDLVFGEQINLQATILECRDT